jgi:hypothetical protein
MFCAWAVFHALGFTLLGALNGSGLAAKGLKWLTRVVIALFVLCFLISFVMQNPGLVPAARLPEGCIGIQWNPKR